MDETTYRGWRGRVEESLAPPSANEAAGAEGEGLAAAQVRSVLAEARRAAAAIAQVIPNGALLDRNKYDFVLSMLQRLLSFDDFVLGEYTYELADGGRPGIRLQLELGPTGHQVAVILFEDVRRWQVDGQGHKVSYQLLELLLGPEGIVVHVADESREYYQPDWGWRAHLREAMCLPLRLLG
ncbi:MAG: hypothetical protein JRI23_24840 [Deltaproteobacteria bacterium]|jgi:hypothetical protein|nr:hypothetical protein [Deltaproteobacteria bacterium]MBW2535240.1 hypothetical protein [Deltaproteobacteria bacterium]